MRGIGKMEIVTDNLDQQQTAVLNATVNALLPLGPERAIEIATNTTTALIAAIGLPQTETLKLAAQVASRIIEQVSLAVIVEKEKYNNRRRLPRH
jgi:hypothetical protein